MTTFTLELDESKAEALREKANRYGLKPEQLVTASIEDLVAQPESDFDEVAKRVLSKNEDLYHRLA